MVSLDSNSDARIAVRSMGHQVFGNRISRTGSHAVCLTGVSCSQVVANQMQHVSLYNQVGTFGHGIAVDGNCGNDPVRTLINKWPVDPFNVLGIVLLCPLLLT